MTPKPTPGELAERLEEMRDYCLETARGMRADNSTKPILRENAETADRAASLLRKLELVEAAVAEHGAWKMTAKEAMARIKGILEEE